MTTNSADHDWCSVNYVFTEKGKEMIRAKRIDTGRQKRASESYSVELFIVVDYAVYQR
jgi:hypothetical protein